MLEHSVLDSICRELQADYAAHTILLYGSHADESATVESDYDLVGFGTVAVASRIARVQSGKYLDVFVYPESELQQPRIEHMRLRLSKVLRDREGRGERFLNALEALYQAGPEPLSKDEIEARIVWAHKMLARASRGDTEGDYRRVWLLQALLEDFFHARGLWYEGPKKALRWLSRNDDRTLLAFRAALRPGATLGDISALVHQVTGRHDA